jgi:hypothetical protein
LQIGSGVNLGDSVAAFKAVASTDTGFNVAKEFFINNTDSIEKAYVVTPQWLKQTNSTNAGLISLLCKVAHLPQPLSATS